MRSGVVKEIREDQPDNGGEITAGNHNYIIHLIFRICMLVYMNAILLLKHTISLCFSRIKKALSMNMADSSQISGTLHWSINDQHYIL